MKKLALALTLTGAAAFSANALAMGCVHGGGGYVHGGGGYKQTATENDRKHETIFN